MGYFTDIFQTNRFYVGILNVKLLRTIISKRSPRNISEGFLSLSAQAMLLVQLLKSKQTIKSVCDLFFMPGLLVGGVSKNCQNGFGPHFDLTSWNI